MGPQESAGTWSIRSHSASPPALFRVDSDVLRVRKGNLLTVGFAESRVLPTFSSPGLTSRSSGTPMESPFAHHLNTNYVPSDLEVKQIQAHLLSHSLELSRLEALIQELSVRRDKTADYINAHQALISPARRLPRDIVQEIFLACLPTHRNAGMSSRAVPLVLARICSAWRTVALSTPALWSSLHLPLEYIFEHGLSAPVTDWLQRSGRCSLFLSIIGSRNLEEWEESHPDRVDTVIEELVRSSARWDRIELSFDPDEGLLRLAEVFAPKLVAIKMTCDPAEILAMKLLTTPSLREFELCIARGLDRYIPQLPLCWDSLTRLSFDSTGIYYREGLSPIGVIGILGRCPRIIHFKSDINNNLEDDMFSYPSGAQVSLLALKEFIICRCSSNLGPHSTTYLFKHLLMPQLRQFHLAHMVAPAISVFPFLGDLAIRAPLIEELSIDLTSLAWQSLFDNLHMLHSLRKLVVVDTQTHQNARPTLADVHTLLKFLGSSLVCPLLCELQIKECRQDADLLGLARQRLDGGGGHFRRLDVEYKFFTPLIAPETLASFVARGVTILTTSPPSGYVEQPPDTPWTGIDE
ncbi:hypothetical protein DFH09DRAFT_1434635 [Mycena vulgaris]|nr:hypothetical protein DFH09DRAFT_1434635 [Mycena vulgaris]